jgi:thiamine-monophosphate kinase
MTSSEFELIQHYFTGLGEGAAVRLGVGDDAAVLQVPEGHVLQISTDTALEG